MTARRPAVRPAPYFDDAPAPHRGAVIVVIAVVMMAGGGLLWNFYGPVEAPHIAAPAGAYKVAPAPDAANAPDPVEQNAMFESLEGRSESAKATPRPAPEAPIAQEEQRPFAAPHIGPAPEIVPGGPFAAQLAALQSEAAVAPAWARFSSRAPALFAQAKLDVERADLGQRGVYYRVRAGYFADRANATLFCDRIKQMGQDCIVVAR